MEPTKAEEPQLWLDRGTRRYLVGETISGGYQLAGWKNDTLEAIELTLLWYTAGQGEEDFSVHYFERHESAQLEEQSQGSFESELPYSPLSYDGQIVKVCWTLRLRGFFQKQKQRVVELPFWLQEEEA